MHQDYCFNNIIGKVINSYDGDYSLNFQIENLKSKYQEKIGFCFVGEMKNKYRD